jgi:AcrR family transcriptional regulator
MTETSARSLRKEQTRARIEQAALELFRRRGFEQVTVEDLARAAQVSPATFYRHFGTKEEVVFAYREPFIAALRDAVASIGDDVPRQEHLPRILAAFTSWLESQHELLALQGELVMGQPALLQRTLAVQRELEAQLASALASLVGEAEPDDATNLAAAVGLAVLRAAVCSWRAGTTTSFSAATERALADLRLLLGSAGSGA